MRKKCVQLSLFDTYTDVLESMENNKSDIIDLINQIYNHSGKPKSFIVNDIKKCHLL